MNRIASPIVVVLYYPSDENTVSSCSSSLIDSNHSSQPLFPSYCPPPFNHPFYTSDPRESDQNHTTNNNINNNSEQNMVIKQSLPLYNQSAMMVSSHPTAASQQLDPLGPSRRQAVGRAVGLVEERVHLAQLLLARHLPRQGRPLPRSGPAGTATAASAAAPAVGPSRVGDVVAGCVAAATTTTRGG